MNGKFMLSSVSVAPLTEQQKQYFNINSGVVVTNVRKGGFLTKMEFPSELLLPT
jgi:hypothetical protein